MTDAIRAERNRTIELSAQEKQYYLSHLTHIDTSTHLKTLENTTINQDIFTVLPLIEGQYIDLLFIDPPYNLTKSFNGRVFKQRDLDEYAQLAFISRYSLCVRPLFHYS